MTMIRIFTVLGFLILSLGTSAIISSSAFADDPLMAEDTPAPSLGTTDTTPAPKVDPNVGTPSAPEAQQSIPLTSVSGKTPVSPAAKAAADNSEKDIYEQYDEYLEKEKNQQKVETGITQRTMFPHENGSMQLGVTYFYKAFADYDFTRGDPRISNVHGANSGPGLSLLFYPLKSLSFGRFGIGLEGAYYLSTVNMSNGGDGQVKNTIYQYGMQAQYEFDYWLGQTLVPYVFGSYDEITVKGFRGVASGSVDISSFQSSSRSYGAGVHLNLNRVEPVVASRALVNIGVRKFYLSYAARQRVGQFSGLTHSLGLTFEF